MRNFSPLNVEDFRQALPELDEVYLKVSKFNLSIFFVDQKGIKRCSGNCNVVYFKNHVLKVFPQKSGIFLVLLYEAKPRNKRPFFKPICKAYLDEDAILTRDGFAFVQGAGKKYHFIHKRKRSRVSPTRKKYSRSKFKRETLAIINGAGFSFDC